MSTYLLTYRVPESYAPGGADVRAAWNAWFESLGASLIDRGNPVFESRPLGECGTGTQPGGYSLIAADDLDAAVRLAGGCPGLRNGAGVEVGVITELNRGPHSLDVLG